MNSKMKKFYAMYAMAGAFSQEGVFSPNQEREFLKREPIKIVPKAPTGAKEYFFTKEGDCFTVKYKDTKFVYSCYAINIKNAIKKFEKWKLLITK